MTRARGITLAASAVAAEAAAVIGLMRLSSTSGGLALVALLHALAVVATVPLLNAAARASGLPRATSLAAITALFVPAVGPLGLAALFRSVGRRARAGAAGPLPTITRMPSLPADAPEPSGEHLGEGALAARLRFARDPAARIKSVLATRRLDGTRATPLLRTALRDPHEDVRLLAYAMLEDRERHADATIRELLGALAAAGPARRAPLNERLANAYWELCYQGLVAGELESFALARALEHLDAAAAAPLENAVVDGDAKVATPDKVVTTPATAAARLLLRGRVLLRQGAPGAARAALEESWRLGMPARTVDPYLRETVVAERGRREGTRV